LTVLVEFLITWFDVNYEIHVIWLSTKNNEFTVYIVKHILI